MATWAKVLSGPSFLELVELDITGGEPFLKKDLIPFFQTLRYLKQKHLLRLNSIAITTNAILTRRVLENTEAILNLLEGSGIQLVLACAMDAMDEHHDRIRNVPGAFEKMQKTLTGLIALRKRFPKLILGLKTTVLPYNVNQLQRINRFARRNDLFSIISPCIITDGRYLNNNRRKDLAFNKQQIDQMIAFFSQTDLQWQYHAKSVKDYLLSGISHRKCTCGFNYAFIRSTGAVHLCPLLPESVGSVAHEDFDVIWQGTAAKRLRHKIGHAAPCRHCTEPGLERYSLYYEGWTCLKLLMQMGNQEFREFLEHMGFKNYF